MKIAFVGIPILFALAIILSTTNAYAPCIEGPGINCNNYPPQALTQINSDKLNYEISEKPVIMIVGVPSAVAHLEVDDFSSNVVFSHDINLSSNGTARLILDISSYKPGVYSVIATSIVSKITATFAVGLEPSGHGINPLQSGLIQTSQANLQIIDLKVLPSKVKVGDKFTVTATLVNNSTVPIVVETGKCSSKDTQVPFFTVMFDNHTKIMAKDINCAGVGWSEILDPGKKNTSTSPDYTLNYTAIESGTANATVTFQYHIINRTDPTQPNIEQTISKSFQFLIHDVNETSAQKPSAYFMPPLKQFKSGISTMDVKCSVGYVLTIKAENGSPACVRPFTVKILSEKGWSKFESIQSNHSTNAKTNPFGIVGLMYYYGGGPCGVGACPLNTFNLKMNSNYTAYLLGYNICDDNSCIVKNDLSTLLPLNVIGTPNYKFIALPENPQWKYDDVFHIQVEVSSIPDNTTAVWTDLGNSTIIH